MYVPLDPPRNEKSRFLAFKIWVITPVNEGCRFPWYVLLTLNIDWNVQLLFFKTCSCKQVQEVLYCTIEKMHFLEIRATKKNKNTLSHTPIKPNSHHYSHTPPKINIEPENDALENDFPLPGEYCQVPC